jgi:hypothetical protein
MHAIGTDDKKHLANEKKRLLHGLHGTLRKKAIGWLKKNEGRLKLADLGKRITAKEADQRVSLCDTPVLKGRVAEGRRLLVTELVDQLVASGSCVAADGADGPGIRLAETSPAPGPGDVTVAGDAEQGQPAPARPETTCVTEPAEAHATEPTKPPAEPAAPDKDVAEQQAAAAGETGRQAQDARREATAGRTPTEPPMADDHPAQGGRADKPVLPGHPNIRVDPEFASLLPALTQEQNTRLEENLVADGVCHDSLVVLKGEGLLLGGHHRLPILREHKIPYTVVEVDLPDREAAKQWIIKDELGKRNLTSEQRDYYVGKLYQAEKQPHGGPRAKRASAQNEHLKTAESLGKTFHASPTAVRRSAKYADDVDRLAAHAGPELRQRILSGRSGLTQHDVAELAKVKDPVELQKGIEERTAGKKRRGAKGKSTATKAAAPTITVVAEAVPLARALAGLVGRERALEVLQGAVAELHREQ